jgi:predicted DNA-binding transcriptional regulator AlpA
MSEGITNKDVIRSVIASFGFPEERVNKAIACLLGVETAEDSFGSLDRVLSFRQACQALSISKSGLRRIINAGELTPIRLSQRRIGFRTQDIKAFVANRSR